MSLHTQAETARHLVEEKHAHYLMIIKANQPSLPEAVTNALAGTDADFTGTSWTEEGKGHGRREKRSIRTVPAAGTGWPHAAQVMRIHRACSGPVRMGCGLPLPMALGHAIHERAVPTQQQSSGSIDARSPCRGRA
jgi:hypothetical protein